jgi:hypothetical protein
MVVVLEAATQSKAACAAATIGAPDAAVAASSSLKGSGSPKRSR